MEQRYYILEYSEQQGQFHFNRGSTQPNTHGWLTICKSLSYEQCVEFAELMEAKYPFIGSSSDSAVYPATEIIKREFIKFLLS